jgi:uncharacterized SAM-binding protein YcdF (DUF218 family)
MFLFKKIVAPIFFPVPLCLEILLVGLILLWFTRWQKAGKAVVSIGFLTLALLGYSCTGNMLLHPLEYKHPPLVSSSNQDNVKWVVVLGGGHTSDPNLPVTSQLTCSSLVRVVEGVRLHNTLPGSKILLSGGSGFDPVPNARMMQNAALAMGVDQHDLILETVSKDTKDQASLVKKIVNKDRFVLVTSASHMPRAMALFEKQGMHPIPAPTGHLAKERQAISPGMFFPSADGLSKTKKAIKEYLGLAWAKLRNQV